MPVLFNKTEKSVGAQCLHETLHRAKSERLLETSVRLFAAIVFEQLLPLGIRQIYIWIVEQRGQIILRQPGTHSLKINQVRLAVPDQNVLRLKIAMDENTRPLRQILCDLVQSRG